MGEVGDLLAGKSSRGPEGELGVGVGAAESWALPWSRRVGETSHSLPPQHPNSESHLFLNSGRWCCQDPLYRRPFTEGGREMAGSSRPIHAPSSHHITSHPPLPDFLGAHGAERVASARRGEFGVLVRGARSAERLRGLSYKRCPPFSPANRDLTAHVPPQDSCSPGQKKGRAAERTDPVSGRIHGGGTALLSTVGRGTATHLGATFGVHFWQFGVGPPHAHRSERGQRRSGPNAPSAHLARSGHLPAGTASSPAPPVRPGLRGPPFLPSPGTKVLRKRQRTATGKGM